MSVQEENYKLREENDKLKDELSSLKGSTGSLNESAGSHDKYEKIQEELIESLDINAKLEAKVAQLKKDKVSIRVGYEREIAFMNLKLEEYQRSSDCHLSDPTVHAAHAVKKLKFKKSTPAVASPVNVQQVLKENVAKLEPKNVKLNSVSDLISWRSVVKNTRPKGTLSYLSKKTTNLIEDGIMNDFLVDRVEKELLADCIAEEGNKSVPAIPKSLVDEFNNWLGTLFL